MDDFPISIQERNTDCGITCLFMISQYYGRNIPKSYFVNFFSTKQQLNLQNLIELANSLGFKCLAVKVNIKKLIAKAPLPCILHWNKNHFVVLHKIVNDNFYVVNPEYGKYTFDRNMFLKSWGDTNNDGYALLIMSEE